MSTDTDDPNAQIFNTPKGGLYGGAFNSTGLDPNVRAVMMDYRWTTSFDGSATAPTMNYSFPTQASDYTEVPGYPAATQASTF